jgi:hypothetical protein
LQQRQENRGAGDEPFPLSNDVVHAVIVVAYAANANGEIGLLAFLVTRAGVSEIIHLGDVGPDPWEPVQQLCTQFCGQHAAPMGIVTDTPIPPTRVGPFLNVPLCTLVVGFEQAEAIVLFFGNQDLGDYLFFAEISEWLRTEGNRARLDTGNIQVDFYLAWAKLFYLCLPITNQGP